MCIPFLFYNCNCNCHRKKRINEKIVSHRSKPKWPMAMCIIHLCYTIQFVLQIQTQLQLFIIKIVGFISQYNFGVQPMFGRNFFFFFLEYKYSIEISELTWNEIEKLKKMRKNIMKLNKIMWIFFIFLVKWWCENGWILVCKYYSN